MVYGVEELFDVAFQDKTFTIFAINAVRKLFKSEHGSVSAFVHSAGIGIKNKCRIKYRIQYLEHCMVNNAISNRGLMNRTNLWISNIEFFVRSVSV